jgi:hypothetical protein
VNDEKKLITLNHAKLTAVPLQVTVIHQPSSLLAVLCQQLSECKEMLLTYG